MGGTPFYQRRWFLAAAAVVTIAGGALTLVAALSNTFDDLFADEVAAYNTMIVLDASGAMRERFGERGTKYDAAARAVKEYVEPLENHGFGLRTLGGRCPGPGRRRVEIGAGHNDDVADALAEVNPRGEANLTSTLIAAVSDLSDQERVPPGNPKRIVVFTGSSDTCGRRGAAALRDHMEQVGVETVVKIVAVRPSRKSVQRLRQFRSRLGRRAELEVARSESQLDSAVEDTQLETRTTTTATTSPTTDTTTTTTETETEPEPDPDPDPEPPVTEPTE